MDTKKGPGRPPKKAAAVALARHGASAQPRVAGNRLELTFDRPDKFKELFRFFKNIKAGEIYLKAGPNGLAFLAQHQNQSLACSTLFPAAEMNFFHCSEETWLAFNRGDVEKFFQNLNKNLHKIEFTVAWVEVKELVITVSDSAVDMDHHYKLAVALSQAPDWAVELEREVAGRDENFELVWGLKSDQFKQQMAMAAVHTNTAQLEALGDEARVILRYCDKSHHNHRIVFNDAEKIGLVSTLGPQTFFEIEFSVSVVAALAGAMLAPGVRIYCSADAGRPLLFGLEGEPACTYVSASRI